MKDPWKFDQQTSMKVSAKLLKIGESFARIAYRKMQNQNTPKFSGRRPRKGPIVSRPKQQDRAVLSGEAPDLLAPEYTAIRQDMSSTIFTPTGPDGPR
jgi:hypothetical protein